MAFPCGRVAAVVCDVLDRNLRVGFDSANMGVYFAGLGKVGPGRGRRGGGIDQRARRFKLEDKAGNRGENQRRAASEIDARIACHEVGGAGFRRCCAGRLGDAHQLDSHDYGAGRAFGMDASRDADVFTACPGCAWWDHQAMLEGTRWESIVILGLGFLAFGWLMARYININKFSLQGMYRNRLIRAYLGASNTGRQPHDFTGFVQSDNVQMHCLDPELKPLHVVNATLNLVSSKRLAWQQRKAESFTVTPLHCGSYSLGYRPSLYYGGPDGISLGTAVAISGAAASPNMGYNSSPVIGFIMTLFNARLGAWLGNPGKAGAKTWRQEGPTSAIASIVREAFGLTNDASAYVYLSDGGHFENLGIYEMVRRRCRYIVVSDSGCDNKFAFEDLGNALRKIRIDMKIPVDFEDGSFQSLREKSRRCTIARIRYSLVDETREDGFLLYIKPMVRGNEPPDVVSYQTNHADFPHQSTADQFFDESQTESYRMLGLLTVDEICHGWDQSGGIPGLIDHIASAADAKAASAMAAG